MLLEVCFGNVCNIGSVLYVCHSGSILYVRKDNRKKKIGFLLLWTQCSTGQKCRLSVVVGCENVCVSFFFFFSKTFLSSDAVLKCVFEWLDYPSVMLSYTIPLFGCEPFLSPNKYFFFNLIFNCCLFFHFS